MTCIEAKESKRLLKCCYYCKINLDANNWQKHRKAKKQKICKSCVAKKEREYYRQDPIRTWRYNTLRSAKKRAANKRLEFDLDNNYLQKIFTQYCPISSEPFVFSLGKPHPNSPSLDRIIPEKGYVKGNVVVISHKYNTYKSNYSLEDLEKLIVYIKKYKGNT